MRAINKAIFAFVFLSFFVACAAASAISVSNEVERSCGAQVAFGGSISNNLNEAQSFVLDAVDPSGWFTYYVTPEVTVESGSIAEFIFLATPSPATPPGEYSLFINAIGASGERLTKTVWVTVKDCTKLAVLVSGAQAACTGSQFPLTITILNNGPDKAFGKVSLDIDAEIIGTDAFAVAPGEARKFNAFATIPVNKSPGTIQVTASASTARGKASGSTALEVRDCAQAISQASEASIGQAGALSGFFSASSGAPQIGVIILAIIAAFIFVKSGQSAPSPKPKPGQVAKAFDISIPAREAPAFIEFALPELPETLRAKRLGSIYSSLRTGLESRAKKLEGKIGQLEKTIGKAG